MEIALSNVDRVMFPDDGLTKGDVIAYYRDVAEVMLPEVRRRALTIERFTKSIADGGFMMKHAQKHYPAWIDRCALGGKKPVTYPICDSADALVYFANQGAITLHVGTSRCDTPDQPDQLVFDLDPPEGGLAMVREVAYLLDGVLAQLELPAFVKTSGSKGLHVVTPLDGAEDYGEVSTLGSEIAALLIARRPELCTTEFYKKDRAGRLFLDTMRNVPGATLVAPYTIRARPGAPVSAPLDWRDVETLTPDGIRLRDVRDRLEAWGDAWSTLRDRVGNARAARQALDRLR